MIRLTTNLGNIDLELDFDKAPLSAENFSQYVKDGFYNGTIFHRVIPGFMIQGGGMEAGLREKTTRAAITNEADNGLQNKRGSIAMARTSDPHSATAQFFINLVDNDFLDFRAKNPQGWGYAVFGRVVEGMDIVDQIAAVKTGRFGYHDDVPTSDIVITSAQIL